MFLAGLALITDLLFLLLGGEYLATLLIAVPTDHVSIGSCYSQHTTRCQDLQYSSTLEPELVMHSWPGPVRENTSWDGTTVLSTRQCNESWLGRHYAGFYKDSRRACVSVSAWVDATTGQTQVFIQKSWPTCPWLVNEYLGPTFLNSRFRCYVG